MASVIKPIEFTPLAKSQLQSTVDYIIKEFGIKSAEKFLHKTERHLQAVAEAELRLVNRALG